MKLTKEEVIQLSLIYTNYELNNPNCISKEEFLNKYEENYTVFASYSDPTALEKVKERAPSTQEIKGILKKYSEKAKALLADKEKTEEFLIEFDAKVKSIPKIGKKISHLTEMGLLVNDYIRGEYTELPKKTLYAIVGALIYFVSPIDFIPDALGPVGYVDDAAVIKACWDACQEDISNYMDWLKGKRPDVYKKLKSQTKKQPKKVASKSTKTTEN